MRFVLLFCLAFLVAGTAHAQTCAHDTPEATVVSCTARIAADKACHAQLYDDYLERSAAEQTEKQYTLSIADANSAIALDRRDPRAYSRLANAYQAAGNMDQWQTAEGKAMDAGGLAQENPDLPRYKTTQEKYEALAVRAGSENNLGLFNAALADENAAIALLPNNSWAYWYRGLTYLNQNEPVAALANLSEAIALAPTDVRPLLSRIRLYEYERRYADAARDETILIRILDASGPDDAPGAGEYNMRCWDRAHTTDLTGALSDCKKAIALLKNSYGFDSTDNKYELLTKGETVAEIYDSAGYVYLNLKLPAKAVYYYSAALGAYPKLASSLYGRGLAEQLLGQTTAASTDSAAAKAIDSKIALDFGI